MKHPLKDYDLTGFTYMGMGNTERTQQHHDSIGMEWEAILWKSPRSNVSLSYSFTRRGKGIPVDHRKVSMHHHLHLSLHERMTILRFSGG